MTRLSAEEAQALLDDIAEVFHKHGITEVTKYTLCVNYQDRSAMAVIERICGVSDLERKEFPREIITIW